VSDVAYPAPHTQPERVARPRFRSVYVAPLVAVAVAALGPVVGWLWAEVAPRVAVVKTDHGFVYADGAPEEAVAADGWFAILGLVVGMAFAVLAWALLRRHRGMAVMIGLALGSLAGAVLAWWVGHMIGLAQFEGVRAAAIGTRLDAPVHLRITDLDEDKPWLSLPTGVAAVQALVAAFVYTGLAGFSPYPNLRKPDPEPDSDPAAHGQFGPGFTGSPDASTGTARM
jgi:hypothetical protein